MAKSQRYQTYMARFDRKGNHRGNDFPRRVLDEYAQRGPVDDRCQQVGGDQLDRPCGRPRRQLRGQSVVRRCRPPKSSGRCRRTPGSPWR